jgi:hypothetical protein
MTRGYKRNGTTTLFADLDVLEGKVIGAVCCATGIWSSFASSTRSRPRSRPASSSTSSLMTTAPISTLKVRAWLDPQPRFAFDYTSKSAPWLDAFEGFFAKLTQRRLKSGVFRTLVDLQAAIKRFLAETNHSPKSFAWTADPNNIIAAVRRVYQT